MPITLGGMKLYTIKELAKLLDVAPLTLRTYIRQGKLSGRKLGVKFYVPEESVKEYFKSDFNMLRI